MPDENQDIKANSKEAEGEAVTCAQIRRSAMDLLARREHSQKELLTKLSRKYSLTHSSSSWGQLLYEVERLRREGLQSDTRMAESFVRHRAGTGQGPVKIRMEISAKGVDESIIDAAMLCAQTDWAELASRVIVKRFGETSATDMKEKAKRVRFLQQRGFSFDHFDKLI